MKKQIASRVAEAVVLFCAILLLLLFMRFEWLCHSTPREVREVVPARVAGMLALCFEAWLWAAVVRLRKPSTLAMRAALLGCLLLYGYVLLSFTLFDPALGRGSFSGYGKGREYYLAHYVNIIPLRSIWTVYIRGFANGAVNSFYMLLNLLGNVCAFMPLALLLPRIWNRMQKRYVLLPTVVGAVVCIELLQLCLMVGSCDIDDLILNAGGAMLCFEFLHIPALKRLTERLL